MTVRHERVVLDLDDRLSSPIARSSASFSAFRRNVDDSGRSVLAFDRTVKSTSPSIDQFSGRLQLLIRTAALLGPGFSPIVTSIIPAVAGLATQLGFAAAAGGTAILAFQGVGDALKTLNEARLDPTAENLAKAHEALTKISPAAQELVFKLQEMRGEFRQLRDAGSEGLMPGVIDSLDSMEELFPRFERIIGNIASASGDMLADGVESLTTDRWEDFFGFLESEARPTIVELGHTVGDLTHGLAELWMHMNPLSRDFTGGLAAAADSFDQWATGLDQTEGFQEFLSYVMDTGPQVLDTLGALANAILQIGIAAAPLGGPVLQILEAFADIISAIAESDIGTPIMTAVAALSALRLAQLAWGKAADATFIRSERTLGSFVEKQKKAARDVGALGGSGNLFSKYDPKAKAARAGIADLGKTVGVAGGLAFAASGVADNLGLANTASLALIGTMAGPWGAAIGGGVGLLMDMSAAGDEVQVSIDGMNRALAAGDLDSYAAEAEKAGEKLRETRDSLSGKDGFSIDPRVGFATTKNAFEGLFGRSDVEEAEEPFKQAQGRSDDLRSALSDLRGQSLLTFGEMKQTLADARPAMDALGISVEDLAEGARDGSIVELGEQIRAWYEHAGSAAGRTDNFVAAVAALGDEAASAEARVGGLQAAMDAMLSPGLNVSAATDAWESGLRNLSKELAENGRSLTRHTNAGDRNRAAIRARVTDLQNLVVAQQAVDPSGRRAARTLEAGAKAIIKSGMAAGLSEREIRTYLKTLGLTPKAINTAIKVSGVAEARAAAASVQASMAAIRDRTVMIRVIQNMITYKPKAIDEIRPADGTTVPGQRLPYGDKIPALLAPGEEVTSNRYGQSDRYRPALKAINANMPREVVRALLADGGTAGYLVGLANGGTAGRGGDGEIGSAARGAAHGLKALKRQLEESKKAIEKEKDQRRSLVSSRNQLRSGVADQFRTDLFSGSDVWSASGGWKSTLKTDIAEAREFTRLLKQLKRRGLSGQAFATLAQTGDVRLAREFASMSGNDFGGYERLFNQRERYARQAGAVAGAGTYGAQISEITKELKKLNRKQDVIAARIKAAGKDTGDRVGKKINGAAAAGKRKRPGA